MVALRSPERLLEIRTLRPEPQPTDPDPLVPGPESEIQQAPQVIFKHDTCF